MNKRQLHHVFRNVRPIKPWYFLGASALSGAVAAVALRDNYATMVKLRANVREADKTNGDIEKALRELRSHVHGHMNTDLTAGSNGIYPPIQLTYRYDRLAAAQKEQQNQANTQIYNDAQKVCEQQNPTDFSGRNRVPCIEQYVSNHPVQTQTAIPNSLYKFDFASPRWSPDIAGWSLVLTMLFLVAAAGLFIAQRWMKLVTK